MVEVVHAGNVAPGFLGTELGAKSALRCAGGGCFGVSAKSALDPPMSGCVAATLPEERVPASPRRKIMQDLISSRCERQAVREQRRLEIERELLLKLGLDSPDSSDPATSSATPGVGTCPPGAEACAGRGESEGRGTAEVGPGRGPSRPAASSGRPPSRSSERPNSARRAGAGPPRPPKPKPHRPLNLSEDSSPASGTAGGSAETLPEDRRWKSALLPFWPDRQGASHDSPSPSGSPSASEPAAAVSPSDGIREERVVDFSATAPAAILSKHLPSPTATCSTAATRNASTEELCGVDQNESQEPALVAPIGPTAATAHVAVSVSAAVATAAAAAATARDLEEEAERERQREQHAHLAERTRQLEVSAQRLRENIEKLKFDNRRTRIFGAAADAASFANADEHADSPCSLPSPPAKSSAGAIPCASAEQPAESRISTPRNLRSSSFKNSSEESAASTAVTADGGATSSISLPCQPSKPQSGEQRGSSVAQQGEERPVSRSRAGERKTPRDSPQPQDSLKLSSGDSRTVPGELVTGTATATTATSSRETSRLEEMRRKIEELDRANEIERLRLEEEQREVRQRRRQQEEFERGLLERTEKERLAREAKEAQAEMERAAREEEQLRERQERGRRRQEQLQQENERSKRREDQRKEGRSEASQLHWQLFEEELDKQWAEQDAEERRRINQYAKERTERYKDWDRRLAAERHKFASEAEFTEAARHRKARNAASADEQFRRSKAAAGNSSTSVPTPPRPPWPPPKPPPPAGASASTPTPTNPEEAAVMKELQSLRGLPRETQKSKVKELLFRWHPDKNPTCVEKATQVFQLVQRQRELVLGL